MSLLFYCDDKNNVVLRPECVKLCPELNAISEKELVFIILAYDYHSPFRQFPEHDRIRRVMFHVFNDNKPELLKKQSVTLATEAYKKLQFDPKIDLADKYQKKIDRLLLQLENDDTPSSIEKITKAIDGLRKNIIGLEKEVTDSVLNRGVIKGNAEMSFLEELQSNMKYYKSVVAPR